MGEVVYFESKGIYNVVIEDSAPPAQFHQVAERSIEEHGAKSKAAKSLSERYVPGQPLVGVAFQALDVSADKPMLEIPESANKLTILIFARAKEGASESYTLPVYITKRQDKSVTPIGFPDKLMSISLDLEEFEIRLSSQVKNTCSGYILNIYYLVHEKDDSSSDDDSDAESIASSNDDADAADNGEGPADDSDGDDGGDDDDDD